ncbi:hypothetical protein [Salinibacterium sp.]|uniref:hypothetical protein n=1 Tax=Salinibacterium sp. TaxID=1915057 RepID=UPI00286CB4DC|nr:hypothetical protein [Salinibacterium sp.]
MTNPLPGEPEPNVRRGLAFALLGIPVSLTIFAIVGLVIGPITSFVAIAIPLVMSGLYVRGASGPLSAGARAPFAGITLVAMVVGTLVGLVAGFYNTFSAVGGDGGIVGSAFQTTVRNQFSNNTLENVIPIVFGLGIGIGTLVSVLRGNAGALRRGGRPIMSRAPVEVDATSPVANQSSPGILLNGKPLDPKEK